MSLAELDETERVLDEEYRRNKEAIARIRLLLLGVAQSSLPFPAAANGAVTPLVQRNSSVNKVDDLLPPLEDAVEGPSLIGKVEEALRSYPQEKWTTKRVVAYLQRAGFPMKAVKPEASVGAILGKLGRAGRIKILRQGSGSTPGLYQWNPDWTPTEGRAMNYDEEEESDIETSKTTY